MLSPEIETGVHCNVISMNKNRYEKKKRTLQKVSTYLPFITAYAVKLVNLYYIYFLEIML